MFDSIRRYFAIQGIANEIAGASADASVQFDQAQMFEDEPLSTHGAIDFGDLAGPKVDIWADDKPGWLTPEIGGTVTINGVESPLSKREAMKLLSAIERAADERGVANRRPLMIE